MKRMLSMIAVLATTFVLAAVTNSRFKYEMGTCPTGTTNVYDSNMNAACITSAQNCSAGTCAGTAPTAATEGLQLDGLSAFRLTICVASGQTLSGAGTMQAYYYSTTEGLWSRDVGLDQTVSATTRCQTFPDFSVGGSFDRVRFVASGVTASGGTKLDVLLDGQVNPINRGYPY